MDEAGTEHESGWVLVEDGLVAAVGAARRPEAESRKTWAARSSPRARQHPSPPVPDPYARPGAGGRSLHLAARRSTRSGRGIDAEAEYAAARTGLAELALSGCTTVFDHHYVFPRGAAASSRPRCARRGSSAFGWSRHAARWTSASRRAACRRTRSSRTSTTVLAETERLAGCGALRPDRGRAVLAVLGLGPADAGVGGARAAARAAAAHAPRRDGRGGRVLPRAVRLPPGRVPRASSAGSTATSGARTASTSTTATSRASRRPARRRALPDLEPAPRRRRRAGRASCSTRASASASASTARRRTSAATCCLEVKQALLVARGRGGPAALTAREALRLGTRGGAAVLGRDDIGSLEPGKRADLAVWRTDGLELGGADDPVAGLVLSGAAPRRPARRRRRGRRARRAARASRRGGDRAGASGRRREDSPE